MVHHGHHAAHHAAQHVRIMRIKNPNYKRSGLGSYLYTMQKCE